MEPPGTSDPTQKWAWDFVALHHCQIGWVSADTPAPRQFWCWLAHEADVGWSEKGRGEPDPLAFEPAEACRTLLSASVLAVSASSSAEPNLAWYKLYEDLASGLTSSQWTDGALYDREGAPGVIRAGGFAVDVEKLTNRSAICEVMTSPLLTLIDEATR